MTKKQIKILVTASYTDRDLDQEKVNQITAKLKRHDLKGYIRALKLFEKQLTVVVTLPTMPEKKEQEKIKSLFPKKKITYIIDPDLLMGIKIVNNDVIHELSLKNTLENISEHLSEVYD